MDNGNISGGNGRGFHGYRRSFPQPTPPTPPAMEMSMGVPAQANNGEDSECSIREQDRFMPSANVIRIMRRILPAHAKISDDSKETIQECVSEFISFVTSEANERCQREQRKTITAEDVLWAMSKLGFDDFIEPLTLYLHRYREFDGGDRGSLRGEPPLMLRRGVFDPPNHLLPPNFPMAHHQYGYFVYPPPPMGNGYMQGGGSTSHAALESDDAESPTEDEGNE
ncbi:Nuclear transcription factor Y subunit B-9 [Capsicum annuum]|uniref:Nuclear transcription factor Y subunit B-9 n=1 Tax=Capsicum annuum TaxID=4072 RepID=A0A1U8F2B7_CAPAN|nr:nuclear transcription factor Y subunit B-6 isoform X2 [Capsicum annuum]PHT64593.1 Nuclear transcription factor Y subunit B-9 [Capsicum annuum]